MDIPANLAQAVAAWAAIEQHLIRHCGLLDSSRLDMERPALIRIVAEALAGVPTLPMPTLPPAERYDPTLPPAPQVVPSSRPVWIGMDLPDPFPRSDGPGYTCRRCGRHVRGQRHTDPRLLCASCMPMSMPKGMQP